jgi:hypothetical protein
VDHARISAPNGIAISPDLKKLYVADDFGIVLVDMQAGSSFDLNAGPHCTVAGIDGLYWWKGNLVAGAKRHWIASNRNVPALK